MAVKLTMQDLYIPSGLNPPLESVMPQTPKKYYYVQENPSFLVFLAVVKLSMQ